jgi:hypothetical protein
MEVNRPPISDSITSPHGSGLCHGYITVKCDAAAGSHLTGVEYRAPNGGVGHTMTMFVEQEKITCNRCGETGAIPLGLEGISADEETARRPLAGPWTVRDAMDLCPVCSLT